MLAADDSTYYMGKYELKNLNEHGFISSDVQKFIIHPRWNPRDGRYDADIAIAVLVKNIKFSDTIRPICIQDVQSAGHSDLVNKNGKIAGNHRRYNFMYKSKRIF